MEILHEHKQIILHGKYKNNFDYNFAVSSLNNQKIVMNGCIILLEDESLSSRIASLHYEFYTDKETLVKKLNAIKDQVQCTVSHDTFDNINCVDFGSTQSPGLRDYACLLYTSDAADE